MKVKSRAYISRNCKVSTPQDIVSLFWRITHKHKESFNRVLDLGAGDGRFAHGGNYKKYVGIEIDERINAGWAPSKRRSFIHGCVFQHNRHDYSACIGNPPYLRHNEISVSWRNRISSRFKEELGLDLDKRSNLYLYFISLGLLKTSLDGLVSVIVPYEWFYIPSATPLREYINRNKWSVHIYRFNHAVFENVLTTASVSIIDKSNPNGVWKLFDVNNSGKIREVSSLTDSGQPALGYEERGRIWGMRGLSPGTKRIFTLSESERIASGLTKQDVRPCVTSLREVPKSLKVLDEHSFYEHFVSKNKKCWLIRSDKRLTNSLRKYVRKIPPDERSTWTCLNQKPWYKYKAHPIPRLLMASAFKKSGPRILLNEMKAIAFGSVIGIHTRSRINLTDTHKKLGHFDFSSKVVSRENGLKKIAVRQLNAALNYLVKIGDGR